MLSTEDVWTSRVGVLVRSANRVRIGPRSTGSKRLAGWRGPWVERAATEASAWIASAMYNDDVLAGALGRYRAAGGRRAICGSVRIVDDPAETIERLRHLADLGFDDAVVFDLQPGEQRLAAVRDAIG